MTLLARCFGSTKAQRGSVEATSPTQEKTLGFYE